MPSEPFKPPSKDVLEVLKWIPELVVLAVVVLLPEVGRVLGDAVVVVAAPPVRVVEEVVRLADLNKLVLGARRAVFVRVPLTSQTPFDGRLERRTV